MYTLPLVLTLLACLRPEEGIDRTRVLGTIRVDPTVVDESNESTNADPFTAIALDELQFGYRVHRGTLTDFGTATGAPSANADTDCWQLVSGANRGQSAPNGQFGWVPDDEANPPVDIDISVSGGTARVTVYNLEEIEVEAEDRNGDNILNPGEDKNGNGVLDPAIPSTVATTDVSGWDLLTLSMPAKVEHALCIAGLEGSAPSEYTLTVSGRHPDRAKLLVGIYANGDPTDRGALLGGTNAQAFESVDRWSFVARYEMLFVREFETDTDGEVVVLDEDVNAGFVYAGNWANLSQKLPAGTWYSSQPVAVDFTQVGDPEPWGVYTDTLVDDTGGTEDTAVEDPAEDLPPRSPTYPTLHVDEQVVVDAIAPIVVGFDVSEIEPNDVPSIDPSVEGDLAQDLGILSGPGFVDIVEGACDFGAGDGYGYWGAYATDTDFFKFQVPERLELAFTLSWDDSAVDLDVIVMDSAGTQLDQGYYGFPEVNENAPLILEPGQDYFIAALPWSSPSADPVPYELRLEQLGL